MNPELNILGKKLLKEFADMERMIKNQLWIAGGCELVAEVEEERKLSGEFQLTEDWEKNYG
jgi:hypothetical protein